MNDTLFVIVPSSYRADGTWVVFSINQPINGCGAPESVIEKRHLWCQTVRSVVEWPSLFSCSKIIRGRLLSLEVYSGSHLYSKEVVKTCTHLFWSKEAQHYHVVLKIRTLIFRSTSYS
jgi:hypothetical protein